jgi:hypothetical protein
MMMMTMIIKLKLNLNSNHQKNVAAILLYKKYNYVSEKNGRCLAMREHQKN